MSLASILEQNKHITLQPNNRIKCSITGHEMPPNLEVVKSYLGSKKLEKARLWYSQSFAKYEPYIVEDRHNPKQLYCKVTRTMLNKIPEKVEKHIQGVKYMRLKKLFLLAEEKKKADAAAQAVKKSERNARLQAYLDRKAVEAAEDEAEDDDEKADFWMPPEDDEDEEDDGNAEEEGSDDDEEEEESGSDEEEVDADIADWVISSANHSTSKKRKAASVPVSSSAIANGNKAEKSSSNKPVTKKGKVSEYKKPKVQKEVESAPTNKPAKQSVSVSGLTKVQKKMLAKKTTNSK